ncbi:DUF5641 domain-containing protein [Trichonephila clavipes]|nr:DUF5641 domain-containing protein [Trichonephila clavipes]
MENKFKSDVELEWEYKNFMEEYEKLGHMSPNKELDGRISYFLPRHAVRRKDSITTKLRVVFDGSCKPPNSNSLNSVLGVGQILQPDIFTLLVVLSWLSSPPRNWKQFVANKTSEILDIPCKQWRYVPSKENPVDLGSRGMSPKDLPDCSLWWEGPQWLCSEEAWPKQPTIKDKRDIEKSVIIETKRTFVFSVYCTNDIIDMFEIKCLKLKKSLPRKNPLAALCPFIDEDGLIRVGGRLQNAQLQYDAKHPIILPNRHKLSSLIEIEWPPIPPLSPHFGGLWEAGVKSVKFHLKRVVGSINLTFEEFFSLLTQIEAVLNSRSLVRLVDNGIDSLNVLTPSHFLVGEEIIGPPETVEESKLTLKGRRTKWKSGISNIKIGDVVIIKEDNLPPSVWPLGKVISTHPVVSDADCCAVGLRSNPGEDMDVCKCIVPLRYGGTLNSRKSSREVAGRGREVEAHGVLPLNWGGSELKRSFTYMVLKATANGRRTSSPLP